MDLGVSATFSGVPASNECYAVPWMISKLQLLQLHANR